MTLEQDGWVKVVYVSDCSFEEWDEDRECAICPNCDTDFAECPCPGCMQEDLFEYKEVDEILYARSL